VIFQLQVPGHFALGYSNGNAVKIRGGRAAVSVCSDSLIGVIGYTFVGDPHFAEGRKTGTLVFSRVGTHVWLYGPIFMGCGSICAGRFKTAVSFVGAAVFLVCRACSATWR